MKNKKIIKKISFFAFSFIMIIFFFVGLAYPEETDFWLVKYGFTLLILEVVSSGFLIFSLPSLSKKKIDLFLIIGFIFYLGFALPFAAYSNILLVPYFIVSGSIKYFYFNKKDVKDELRRRIGTIFFTAFSFSFSIVCALLLSPLLTNIFPTQIELLKNVFVNLGGGSGDIAENPGIIALWGVFYFVFLMLFDLILHKFKSKTETPH